MTDSREIPAVERTAASLPVAEGTLEEPLRIACKAAASSTWPVLVVGEGSTGRRTIAHAYGGARSPSGRPSELKARNDVVAVLDRLRAGALDSPETVFIADLNLRPAADLELVDTLGREARDDPSGHLRVIASLRTRPDATFVPPEAAPGWLRVDVQPLRDRPEEALRLLRYFAGAVEPGARVEIERSAEGLALLHHWPGNAAEVRSVFEQLRIESTSRILTGEGLRTRMRPPPPLPRDLVQVRRARCLLALILAGDAGLRSNALPLTRVALQSATGIDRTSLGRVLDELVAAGRVLARDDGKVFAVASDVVRAWRDLVTDLSVDAATGGADFVRAVPTEFPAPSVRELLWAVVERGEVGNDGP